MHHLKQLTQRKSVKKTIFNERFYSGLTETVGKKRYKKRSDEMEETKSEGKDLRAAYYLHSFGGTYCAQSQKGERTTHTKGTTILSNLHRSHEYD